MIRRFIASTIVAIVAAFITAIVVTIADLYLTGHGYPSISREVLPAMSPADVLLLGVTLAAWLGTWFALGRSRP